MFCILAPEMALGHVPVLPKNESTTSSSSNRGLRRVRSILPHPTRRLSDGAGGGGGRGYHTLGAVLGIKYEAVKTSVRRASSVKVTRRERTIPRAQDLFANGSAEGNGDTVQPPPQQPTTTTRIPEKPPKIEVEVTARERSSRLALTRSSTPFSLDKPLPKPPDTTPTGSELGDNDNDDENEDDEKTSLMQLFEDYMAALALIDDDQSPHAAAAVVVAAAPLRPAPSEEEWLSSSRHHSRPSTGQTPPSDDEPTSRRGGLGKSSGGGAKTLTPMTSIEDSVCSVEPLSSSRALLNHAIIDEVSEPETCERETSLTPRRLVDVLLCSNCGGPVEELQQQQQQQQHQEQQQDETPQDVEQSPLTALQDSPKMPLKRRIRAIGPSFVAMDELGRRYALYPRTSYYEAMPQQWNDGGREIDYLEDATPRTDPRQMADYSLFPDFEWSSPVERPGNPDPYDQEQSLWSNDDYLPARHPEEADSSNMQDWNEMPMAEHQQPDNSSPLVYRSPPPAHHSIADMKASRYRTPRTLVAHRADLEQTDYESGQTFWKNPDGVIVVYQGVELNGKEEFYGSDINYLGSYYDDDEGSSGLGSHRASNADLVGTSSGLAVIPEGPGSDELWDEDDL